MLRIDTLRRSLVAVLPLAALAAGCAGTEVNETQDPEARASVAPAARDEGSDEGSGPMGEARPEEGEVVTPVVDDGAEGENGPDDPIALSPDGNVPRDEYVPGDESAERRTEGEDEGWAATLREALEAEPETFEATSPEGEIGASSDALLAPRRETVWREAKRNTVELNKSTSYYSHTTYMNERTDTRRTDCSGFIGYVLNRTYRSAYDVVPTPGSARVLSKDWYDYLVTRPTSATSSRPSSPKWRKMNYVRNLRPGDMLVWKNPSGYVNTGHTMIVRDYPRTGRASRNEILVPIYDATSARHDYKGKWDSRTSGWRTGVGAATLGVKVDASGRPIAYYWTGGASGTAVYRKMTMGRLE